MAIALRPGVHSPKGILKLASILDGSSVGSIFIPDVPSGFESIELSCGALALTSNVSIGSGIIRILEHEEKTLLKRLVAIQSMSGNRFILGVGTGSPGSKPRDTIDRMLARIEAVRAYFEKLDQSLELKMPSTYIATLKSGIAKRVKGHSTGLLLNFCSPEYAKSLISSVGRDDLDYACYLKVFYSRNQRIAEELFVEEFSKYDSLPQYHAMFEKDGLAESISKVRSTSPSNIPGELKRVSLANPTIEELKEYVDRFVKSGVKLPCVYPYFAKGEDPSYIVETIKKIKDAF
jgi:alkanesulfonate monooxygenase SsuD/methylene tetrahydromethanopterin reductase-like flavin-dependent oxidoreductase (luciferase family)